MGYKDRLTIEPASSSSASVSAFASQVYGWLTSGLGLTSLIAFLCYRNDWFMALAPFNFVIILAAFGVSMVISLGINRLSFATAAVLFMTYSLLQGLMFGIILPLYAMQYGGDIVWVAFATAGVLFATATIYGRYTRSDLTQVAQLLNFGVLALLIISVVFAILSFFMRLPMMDLIIAYIGLGIFVGLIVTDSQQIRRVSEQIPMNGEGSYKLSLLMALRMYINVIMVFLYLLRILSSSRSSNS